MKRINYVDLSKDEKEDMCIEFQTIYPLNTIQQIHNVFTEINPSVHYNNGFNVWDGHRIEFETLLKLQK